jgi:hypothetical protein
MVLVLFGFQYHDPIRRRKQHKIVEYQQVTPFLYHVTRFKATWYRAQLMASKVHSTIHNAMKKECLALPNGASQFQT